MVRLILILVFCVALAAIVVIVASALVALVSGNSRHLRPILGTSKDEDMASSGIQKAAYIALIIVLFGVASGWLGGL